MTPFNMYVLLDKRGRIWRYGNGYPVIWHRRKDAHDDYLALDAKRGWKVTKVRVADQVGADKT